MLGEGALLCVLYMCCGPVVSGASRVAAVTCRRGSDGMPLQPLPWDLETLDEAFCLLYTVITHHVSPGMQAQSDSTFKSERIQHAT